jgi:hypothetical protein
VTFIGAFVSHFHNTLKFSCGPDALKAKEGSAAPRRYSLWMLYFSSRSHLYYFHGRPSRGDYNEATSGCPTDGPVPALLVNTKGLGNHALRRSRNRH